MREKKVSVSVLLIPALAVEWGKEGEKAFFESFVLSFHKSQEEIFRVE